MSFPDQFVWGAAQSSYQTEGAWDADGKGPSIWDVFCREPGKTFEGHTAEVACDFYHRFVDDIKRMKDIGLQAFRFSISWPRVLPQGTGPVNQKGLDFYSRLVDELLAADIDPWPTLYHWDMPLAIHHRGSWLNRDSPDWFGQYASLIAKTIGDRVTWWMTLNEPQVHTGFAFRRGWHAPGWQVEMPQLFRITHHHLMAHGRAVAAIRQHAKNPAKIGIASAGFNYIPASDTPADIEAARRQLFGLRHENLWNTGWINDAIHLGQYPIDQARAVYGDAVPDFDPDDLKIIAAPLDFVGINVYQATRVAADSNGDPVKLPHPPGTAYTPMQWPVVPDSLYWTARLVAERYKLPIVVTENGLSGCDWIHSDGAVHDPQRIDYVARHLRALERAIDHGIDIRGYLYWSFMDNFEWHMGYPQRFGLTYVDYATQKRTPKDSGRWYADVIATNGRCLSTD